MGPCCSNCRPLQLFNFLFLILYIFQCGWAGLKTNGQKTHKIVACVFRGSLPNNQLCFCWRMIVKFNERCGNRKLNCNFLITRCSYTVQVYCTYLLSAIKDTFQNSVLIRSKLFESAISSEYYTITLTVVVVF